MNPLEELLRAHLRGVREAISEASLRADALEALIDKLSSLPMAPPPQPTARPGLDGWSKEEDQCLLDNYPALGSRGCEALLPHRSNMAIRTRASKIGVVHAAWAKRAWCPQCEAKVSPGQVAACQSRFCKGKTAIANGASLGVSE